GEIYTLAEMFKDAGYTTGAFGKWGLGYVGSEGDANAQGFDEFFGYNCQRMAHRYYPEYLWLNQEKYPLEGNDTKNMAIYAPKVIQERALDFIRKNKDQPFFAYVPIVQPHAELLAEDDEILQYYKNKIKDDVPYLSTKPGAEYGSEDFDYMQYCSQTHTRATFAAMIATVDRYVGEIMDEVERLGLTENTVILFASDNGPHQEGGADPDYFNSNWDYRGYKRSLTDGGIRTPFIVSWKGQIAAGSGSEHVSAFWDMLPTMAELAGVELTAPTDGISMVAELTGKGEQHKHEFLYWEYSLSGGLQILRMDQWKVHRTKVNNGPNGPVLLYNILEDKEELNDVAAQHPDVVKRALEIMDREHVPSDVFPFTYEKKK
ncbi:MAG: sulfatase-like hydrolase/transferase, partial [Rikenellaceae bacterium]